MAKRKDEEDLSPQEKVLREKIMSDRRVEIEERFTRYGMEKPKSITQERLLAFLQLESAYLALKERYEAEEKYLQDAIELMVKPEDGNFAAYLEVRATRRPSWKDHFIRTNSKEVAEQIAKETEPTFSVRLIVKVKSAIKEAQEKLIQGLNVR